MTSHLLASDKILLPPKPNQNQNSKTLLGIDTNKNKVRDDVEYVIWNFITKDPEQFKAYLSFAQSTQDVLVAYPNAEDLKQIRKQTIRDMECISLVDQDQVKRSQSIGLIIKEIYNTLEREKVLKWKHDHYESYSEDYVGPKSSDKKVLCRFIK